MPGGSSILSLHQIKGGCCAAGGFWLLLRFGSLHCLVLTFQLCWIISFVSDLCKHCGQKLFSETQQVSKSCVAAVWFYSRHFKIQALRSQWITIKEGLYAEVSNLNEMALQPWARAVCPDSLFITVLGRECSISFVTQIDLCVWRSIFRSLI